MIELLSGSYDHEADHSMAAKWRPAEKRPFYAEADLSGERSQLD